MRRVTPPTSAHMQQQHQQQQQQQQQHYSHHPQQQQQQPHYQDSTDTGFDEGRFDQRSSQIPSFGVFLCCVVCVIPPQRAFLSLKRQTPNRANSNPPLLTANSHANTLTHTPSLTHRNRTRTAKPNANRIYRSRARYARRLRCAPRPCDSDAAHRHARAPPTRTLAPDQRENEHGLEGRRTR